VTFDPTPLLKVFGATADVAGQIATDKAINGRRRSKGETATDALQSLTAQGSEDGSVRIEDGQLFVDFDLSEPAVPGTIAHDLGRTPVGAIVVKQDAGEHIYCSSVGPDAIGMSTDSGAATTGIVTVWVF
jgi:hypothetical protein